MIACCRHLFVVGQAGGIAIYRPRQSERARFSRHQLGEIVFVAGDGFGNHNGGVVGGARHQSLDRVFDRDGLTRVQAELGWRLVGGVLGDPHFGIELHLAGIEALEQEIKRHDLGERGGMAARVGIVGGEGCAGVAVDDDGRKRRAVTFVRLMMVARGMVVPGAARLGGVACENNCSGDRDQAVKANSQNLRGRQGCTKHKLPRPNFCLGHRFVRPNYAQQTGAVFLHNGTGPTHAFGCNAYRTTVPANKLFVCNFSAARPESGQVPESG